MQRAIVGFDQDELGDWRAILACGHRQHVRHNPPLVSRPWVLREEGRQQFLGAVLDCKACDEGEPVSDGMLSPETLEGVYRQFQSDLHHFIEARADAAAAEDILCHVYRAIHAHAGDVGRDDRLVSWLDQIVRRAIGENDGAAQPQAALPDRDDRAADLAAAVRGMLACLPGTYRQVLLMAEERGLTLDEIAERLDIPVAEAVSRVEGGREMWREALLDWCHFQVDRGGSVLPYEADCPTCAELFSSGP